MSFISGALGLAAPQAALVAKGVEIVAVLAIAGGGIGWFAHHERGIELAKLEKSSKENLDKANKKIQQQVRDHNQFVIDNGSKTDGLLAANKSLSDTRDQLVRNFDAYRRTHPDLPRPASGPTATSQGECGAQSCGDLAASALQDSNDLARSVGELRAVLQGAQWERDSLNGLPK